MSRLIYADQIVAGNRIVPPGRKRPVTVIEQLSDPGSAEYFEFVVRSASGTIACRYDTDRGVCFGDPRTFPWDSLALPLTVLHDPRGQG